jgi:hypothetical protein
MGYRIDTVIKRFAGQEEKDFLSGKSLNSSHGNVYYRGKILYSYGTHFPLAIFLGVKDGKNIFLKNGDFRSRSTASHQGETQRNCYGPTASFRALKSAGADPEWIGMENIVDLKQDQWSDFLLKDPYGSLWQTAECCYHMFWQRMEQLLQRELNLFEKPKQGQYIPHREKENLILRLKSFGGAYTSTGKWHTLGGMLLAVDVQIRPLISERRHILCALDEVDYFISHLPKPVSSIQEAVEILKPEVVQNAEKAGLEVRRQGEWFFIPTKKDDKAMAKYLGVAVAQLRKQAKQKALPHRLASNRHVAKIFEAGEKNFASGVVYHRNSSGKSTGEHRPLKLGEMWHEVARNTEIQSWTVNGKFD